MCQSSKIDEKDVELLRNGSVHEFYHLKALTTLEQVTTSEAEKKKNLSEQNYDGEGDWSRSFRFFFLACATDETKLWILTNCDAGQFSQAKK